MRSVGILTVTMRAETTAEVVKVNKLVMERMESWLFGIFAAFALLLAVIGLYGLVACTRVRPRRGKGEIGIRMALGSTRAARSPRGVASRHLVALARHGNRVGIISGAAQGAAHPPRSVRIQRRILDCWLPSAPGLAVAAILAAFVLPGGWLHPSIPCRHCVSGAGTPLRRRA